MRIISTVILASVSFLIGFLAQRSRMCFIAGLRDFILVRDRELLKGLFSFLATIWLLSSVLYALGFINDGIPAPLFDEGKTEVQRVSESAAMDNESTDGTVEMQPKIIMDEEASADAVAYELQLKMIGTGIIASPFMWISIIGGFLLGLITTGAGGCALRQHVLAAQGHGDARMFLIGFFTMVIIYDLFLRRIVNEWF